MSRVIYTLVGLLAMGPVLLWGSSRAAAAPVPIEAGNLYFCNASHQGAVCETTVTAGDTVTWNVIAAVHTVTQCDDSFSTCPPAGGFNSGPVGSGSSFSHTFDTPGVYAYHCSFHPADMKGRITVQAAATATPTAAPTAAPTGTGTPSPTATAAPAAVPRTGGDAGSNSSTAPWASLIILAGAVLLAGAGTMWLAAKKETP